MLKAALKDLRKSGISRAEAEEAGFFTVRDASEIHPSFKPWPALVLPYADPFKDDLMTYEFDGDTWDFCRVRYYPPTSAIRSPIKKKELRYGQPPGSGVKAFFPQTSKIDWAAVADDPDELIVITEGEKKALAGCLAGVPTIGLGGVYNFSNDGELLDELLDMEWEGRPTYICYDSDASNNSAIQAAEARIGTVLALDHGALPFLCRIPDDDGVFKIGLDDFIVKNGSDAFYELLDKASYLRPMDKAILKMNQQVAWVADEGMLYDIKDNRFIRKDNFISGDHYASQMIEVPNQRGQGTKKISVAKEFLVHPLRRGYASTVFDPSTTDRVVRREDGAQVLNRFRGLEGTPGDAAPFFELYDHAMSFTQDLNFPKDLVWKLACWKVQNLEKLPKLAILFLGDQGGGKSLLCDMIYDMFKPYAMPLVTDAITGDFNGWVENNLCIVINEAKATPKLQDRLKQYITDTPQYVVEKYMTAGARANQCFFLLSTNETSVAAFPDDDRRMIVLNAAKKHPDGKDFYAPIWKWYEDGGPKKLLHYFQNYDLEGWQPPINAPLTQEKAAAHRESLDQLEEVAYRIKQGGENLVLQWIHAAKAWAVECESRNDYVTGLAKTIMKQIENIQIRPFYTADELAILLPQMAALMNFRSAGGGGSGGPVGKLSSRLRNQGIRYLLSTDPRGFMWRGQMSQFLVISDREEWEQRQLTQEDFELYMASFPTYREYAKGQSALSMTPAKKRAARKRSLDSSS